MFAFIKDDRGGKLPIVAGDSLRKIAGKAMAIEYRVPWKEASGRLQYGLNTPDGVNMVVLLVQETLEKNRGHCAMTIDGENAFN
jgi:hypothetical protein